jgi:hypothetical protein
MAGAFLEQKRKITMRQLSHPPVNRGTKRRENQELEINPAAGYDSVAALQSALRSMK